MKNYYRIRTDIAKDQVVKAKLTQDVDFLEILSLKIRQEDTYKLHVSNYGIIVGRVLANDAFGIPNAKVSVFIPLEDEDKLKSDITNLYPYTDIQTKDKDNRRYNLLPDESNDICYRVVGTFPNKRLVLDNQTEIEIFEKYWKYTTVTNKSGDYMIFGVPTGSHQVHVDVDLSDIGVLSQKPRDFMYKGYSITQFDNSSQFKESTNLDNLSQLLSQTSSVYVYPFWGDSDVEQIAITRCDLQVQYKFEPTCVFFGCIVSDNFSNNIGDKCNPSKFVGFNRNLVAGEGTIEMIRKTQDGLIEEFQIQGNRLIDGDGVWCYQIPMNLDYVGTDEFGNIVPTDDPNKGIPTRTSVRFRISMQETSSEGVSRHRAKYLVPNVHHVVRENNGVYVYEPNKYTQCYEFGSATPDDFFRDLYWNKVYSVKNYIPRIQLGSSRNTQKYSAIRTANVSENLNPFPFNHARFRLFFAYRVLCILMMVVFSIICALNALISFLPSKCFSLPLIGKICLFGWICDIVKCIPITGGLTEDEDSNIEFFPCCDRKASKCMKCEQAGCVKETSYDKLMNTVQQSLAQEYDTVNLDFYNDWVNGCLYLPLWFWKKTKKKKFLFGLFSKKAINRYCNCDSNYKKLRITENCSLHTDSNYLTTDSDSGESYHYQFPDNPTIIGHGIIKEIENKDGLKVYYYSPGVPTTNDYRDTTDETVPYARLYSTDIILLGSLNECDLDNLPRPFINLPSSTANIPYIATLKDDATDSEIEQDGTEEDKGITEVTGMDWLGDDVNNGLFMDLTCIKVKTKPKTCINLARMSELGVTLDVRYFDAISSNGVLKYDNERPADGMITRYELVDNETRAMFASLNHNGLQDKTYNPNTGYDTYKLIYNYPTDFDGHMNKYSPSYTSKEKVVTYDNQDMTYVDYKFGTIDRNVDKRHFYSPRSGQMPLFNNSFYFYFGLNEGNTAIDKFNNLFYSECFKNYKYPFSMVITTTPAKWCKQYDNINYPLLLSDVNSASGLSSDYATIDVMLKSIKIPYSYKLYNEFNMELISESDIYTTELKFGYDVENGTYSTKKNGALKYLTSGDYFTYETDGKKYVYLLDNGNYYLEVTDFNGNTIKQPISISQSSIMVNNTVIGLGDKYYDGTTVEDDICNEFSNYGEIIINSISIDGKNYGITKFEKSNERENSYKLTCVYNDPVNGQQTCDVLLSIDPTFEDFEFDDCICKKDKYAPTIPPGDTQLYFKIWIPGDYKITVTQYCNGELNDNTTSETVNVPNGNPFLTFLGNTPVRFIIGKNTAIDNKNFYSKIADTTISENNSINGWFNLHNEDVYKFEGVSNENQMSVWSDYIDVNYVSGENGGVDDISLSTKLDIIDYKFKCLMEMSNTYYIGNSEDRTLYYGSSGGKAPILYRGCYPEYSRFDDSINSGNVFQDGIFDSDANITCLSRTPNIISINYAQYNEEMNGWFRVYNINEKLIPHFNELFNDKEHIGNYFAAFTSNAGCQYVTDESGVGSWIVNPTIKYQSNPYSANPYVPDVEPGGSASDVIFNGFSFVYGNSTNASYFRALTVDRRLDYALFMILPYNENSGVQMVNNGNAIWRNGRIVGYQYNGIEMTYDNNYNIVGVGNQKVNNGKVTYDHTNDKDYEYYLPKISTSSEDTLSCFKNGEELKIYYNESPEKKRLYSCVLRCGKTYELKDKIWGEGRLINTTPINELMFNDYSNNELGDTNGVFSIKNYPTIRKLDVYNFPSSNRYSFSATSCSYSSQLELLETGGSYYEYSLIIDEGESVTFDVSGRNEITLNNGDLDESAANSTGNVVFTCKSGGSNATFTVKGVDITFKVPEDTTNTTHKNFIYVPYYTSFDYNYNPFEAIHTILLNKSLDDTINKVLNTLNNSNGKCKGEQLDKSSVISTSSDFWGQAEMVNWGLPNDIYQFNKNRFISKSNNSMILYSDDSIMKSVSFRFKKTSNPIVVQDFKDFLSIYYFRRYINYSSDNLSKDILTLNIGTIADIRNFTMSCKCETDNTMSDTDDVEIEVPTIDTDEEGNTTTGSSTSSDTVEIQITRQVTTFLIKIPNDGENNYNHGFTDPEKISASIKYGGKIASDATITTYTSGTTNYISIKLIWGGALSGVLLTPTPADTELFIKMPNGLIFKLEFKLNSSGIISN